MRAVLIGTCFSHFQTSKAESFHDLTRENQFALIQFSGESNNNAKDLKPRIRFEPRLAKTRDFKLKAEPELDNYNVHISLGWQRKPFYAIAVAFDWNFQLRHLVLVSTRRSSSTQSVSNYMQIVVRSF